MSQPIYSNNMPLKRTPSECSKSSSPLTSHDRKAHPTPQLDHEKAKKRLKTALRDNTYMHRTRMNNRMIVMVIDDEPSLVMLMKQFLKQFGVGVKGFSNARHAVDWYHDNFSQVALIYLDMKMPIMNGEQAFHHLKSVNDKARVVLMSGFAEEHNIADLLTRGAERFIQKPFDYPSLIDWTLQQLDGTTNENPVRISN